MSKDMSNKMSHSYLQYCSKLYKKTFLYLHLTLADLLDNKYNFDSTFIGAHMLFNVLVYLPSLGGLYTVQLNKKEIKLGIAGYTLASVYKLKYYI